MSVIKAFVVQDKVVLADYELAKRDQRMLDSLKLIPRRTKLCLRNYLTRRFPAVPVPAEILKRTFETEKNGSVVGLELDGEDDEDESDYIDVGNDLTYIGSFSSKTDTNFDARF